ncbi:glycosyltransferase family 4 protein [Paracraurococcus lichenis]|uniref:Glycosyltransferase family 4 protein n=1 Tax=Paracraurococcus lichenis TaxID=3064888 RepID=A0ABT9DSF9_9PROT|nr:glycosyltransferase family 4 protein [Paracraurococcus sp. LOR1-02]MDO9706831.1 glycosyltransferase family 4 protein [Paracraurococcus sp. LOR1-02]
MARRVMTDARSGLTAWTPLPPERNGIADYAHVLLGGLAAHYDCRAACEDWLASAPAGVAVVDAALAHRDAGPRVLHQIGNNPGHGFVLHALRRVPGVVTLHDPGLLYLYETAGEDAGSIRAGMAAALPGLAQVYGRHHREQGLQTVANHLLFDLAGETLARSRAVIVHSRYALNRLRLVHGPAATAHVAVIPHFLPPGRMPERAAARARLGIGADEFLVLTAGFATRAKRFDWLIQALDMAMAAGAEARWIHAGAERAEEFALSRAIAARPGLAGRARVTGYLDEARLDDHVAAADVLVNLRFPSSGESSGSLARAFAAGTCCIVSDTAAYAEIPRDTVVQVPLTDSVPLLARTLHALAHDPARARAIGERGRRYALAEMALPGVAARYRAVIEDSLDRPVAAPAPAGPPPLLVLEAGPRLQAGTVARALAGRQGPCRLLLALPDLAALARLTLDRPRLLAEVLPLGARLRATRVQQAPRPGLLLDLELGWPA